MAPCERAGASCHSGRGAFRLIAVRAVEARRDRLVVALAGVLSVVVIPVRHEAVLFTPEGDRGPLGVGGEVPACALCLAAGAGGVKVNVCRRILARQTVRCRDTAVGQLGGVYDVLVLGVPKSGDFLPVYNKSRVGAVVAAGQHVAVLKFRDIHHNGRQIRVVHKNFIVRAHAFECQTGKIKVCHCHVLLFGLFNAPEYKSNVAHVERVLLSLHSAVHTLASAGHGLRAFLRFNRCLSVSGCRDHYLRHIAEP